MSARCAEPLALIGGFGDAGESVSASRQAVAAGNLALPELLRSQAASEADLAAALGLAHARLLQSLGYNHD